MHEDVFPIGTLKAANRLHSTAASTSAVSYLPVIDVTGVQAKGAVVAMMPSRRRRTDETTTLLTLEHFFVRVAIVAGVTWLRVMLFTLAYNSPV